MRDHENMTLTLDAPPHTPQLKKEKYKKKLKNMSDKMNRPTACGWFYAHAQAYAHLIRTPLNNSA